MEHLEAIRTRAVERYLLNELPAGLREEFEEHYFDCRECASDLSATSTFIDAARKEFQVHPVQTLSPVVRDEPLSQPPRKNHRVVYMLIRRPAILLSALAASLLVIAYQNVSVLPHLESQVAELNSPEILPTISLIGSNSRGGPVPSVRLKTDHPYLLTVDIPGDDRFESYQCELQAPSGRVAWVVPVNAESAKDSVTIHAPAMRGNGGRYTLVIQGNVKKKYDGNSSTASIELARDPFDLIVQH